MSSLGKRWRNVNDKNRLSIVRPHLVKFWDYEKNFPVTPDDVSFGSAEKFWFICEKCKTSHLANITNRRTGKECPNYDHSETQAKNIPKERTVYYKKFYLVQYWHPIKNKELTPKNVAAGSRKNIYFQCPICKTEWKRKVHCCSNIKHMCPNPNCPNSYRLKVSKGKSLQELFPEIAIEWYQIENGLFTPNDVSYGSSKKFSWKCKKCGHIWMATIENRTNKKYHKGGCPCCAGRIASKNNCVASKYPHLIKEWHPTKNGKLTPYNTTPSSGRKIIWTCSECGLEWTAKVNDRANNHNCPHCMKIILKDGKECDSQVEAYFYLQYKKRKAKFKHNKKYHKDFGRYRYDFYFMKENKYVEVTSFVKRYARYKQYIKIIRLKKKFVEKILKAKFEFIQHQLTKKEREYVRKNMV